MLTPVKCVEQETSIQVDPDTNNPQQAWSRLSIKINKQEIEQIPLDTPIYENKVRFVCVSDTHSVINRMTYPIPAGDVLIHAGDFTKVGGLEEVEKFAEYLNSIKAKFKYIVVIAGNHDLTFDSEYYKNLAGFRKKTQNIEKDPREFLKDFIYLEDSMIELFGLKIYGSPWQPRFYDWAFNLDRGNSILKVWNKIPNDTDILITHGPPLGFGDKVNGGYNVGCCELLSTIRERVRPKFHIFGHIHEDHGAWTDGTTTYINASICNLRYIPNNPPILFDVQLPEGVEKLNIS